MSFVRCVDESQQGDLQPPSKKGPSTVRAASLKNDEWVTLTPGKKVPGCSGKIQERKSCVNDVGLDH
jgi:hypothetical protein